MFMSNKTFQSLLHGVTCILHVFECILHLKDDVFKAFFFKIPSGESNSVDVIFLPGNIFVFDFLRNKYQHSVFCCFKGETSMSSKAVYKVLGNSQHRPLSTF